MVLSPVDLYSPRSLVQQTFVAWYIPLLKRIIHVSIARKKNVVLLVSSPSQGAGQVTVAVGPIALRTLHPSAFALPAAVGPPCGRWLGDAQHERRMEQHATHLYSSIDTNPLPSKSYGEPPLFPRRAISIATMRSISSWLRSGCHGNAD